MIPFFLHTVISSRPLPPQLSQLKKSSPAKEKKKKKKKSNKYVEFSHVNCVRILISTSTWGLI